MAAQAALRCGVGLLQIAVEERLYPLIAQAVPQAVYIILDWENRREESEERLFGKPCGAALPAWWAAAWGRTLSGCAPWCSLIASGPWWRTRTLSIFSPGIRAF